MPWLCEYLKKYMIYSAITLLYNYEMLTVHKFFSKCTEAFDYAIK